MNSPSDLPADLVWDLQALREPVHAGKFFQSFRNSFLIYSRTIGKLYSKYNSHFTGGDGKTLVILPDFTNFDAIYHDIRETAVIPTDVYIFAERINGKNHVYLSGRTQDQNKIKLPFIKGLKTLRKGGFQEGSFLPVLMQGDLREMPDRSVPYLRLNRIEMNELDYKSTFERDDIEKASWFKVREQFLRRQ